MTNGLTLMIYKEPFTLGEEIAPTQTRATEKTTTTTRKFPPGTFINIDPKGVRPTSTLAGTVSTATRKLIVRPTTSTIVRPPQVIGSVLPPAARPTISTPGNKIMQTLELYRNLIS